MHKSISIVQSCCYGQQSFVTSKLAYWKTAVTETTGFQRKPTYAAKSIATYGSSVGGVVILSQ